MNGVSHTSSGTALSSSGDQLQERIFLFCLSASLGDDQAAPAGDGQAQIICAGPGLLEILFSCRVDQEEQVSVFS